MNEQPVVSDREHGSSPELHLTVSEGSLAFFASLLQYGIELESERETALGKFLCTIPGFSEAYIKKTVQTIFIDGTAIDDLKTPLGGSRPVVALSAAMPGLAGAIFRKGGMHASLRTATGGAAQGAAEKGKLTVVVKLFNQIAHDKGLNLLTGGVVMACSSLAGFFGRRQELYSRITGASINGEPVAARDIAARIAGVGRVRMVVSEGGAVSPA